MATNGKRRPPRPRIEIAPTAVSPEEAAAIAAGLQQFLVETAPAPAPPPISRWQRAALHEGVERSPPREHLVIPNRREENKWR